MRRFVRGLVGGLFVAATAFAGCGDDPPVDPCEDGVCVCEAGASCALDCAAPPCHVTCEGDNPSCEGACGNGTCTCGDRSNCDFSCQSPPCHVACGQDAECSGTCANGECTCGAGSTCAFQCGAPPCHVTCDGQNPSCSGTCANGTCACGPGSACEFTCESGPCHTTCAEGASCLVRCPNGDAGTQGCDISTCAAGEALVCPDGKATTCGVPCPAAP